MNNPGRWLVSSLTRTLRRHLVGPEQRWIFEPPAQDWNPPQINHTSLYLHVPFCRHTCPYCPYTKVPYHESLVELFTKAAMAEIDWWANAIGPAEISSIYIGGGTPTLALDSVARLLDRMNERFSLKGEICIETNPSDVNDKTVRLLRDMGVTLVSLGVESFNAGSLSFLGRDYKPLIAERALSLLVESGFASVNADLIFALPGQTIDEVTADLIRAEQLGVNQITTYPLFTFPYTSVGKYLRLKTVQMPDIRRRRDQYLSINRWCADNDFKRVSVWGFKRGTAPRYSSVTRDGYIGIGPGAGSHLPDCFVLNTFDLKSWIFSMENKRCPIALRMPYSGSMSGWWWLYWRLYDTQIPLNELDAIMGKDAKKARLWLTVAEKTGLAVRIGNHLDLTVQGVFWLHLVQNFFALNYVNTLWTEARIQPWPQSIEI